MIKFLALYLLPFSILFSWLIYLVYNIYFMTYVQVKSFNMLKFTATNSKNLVKLLFRGFYINACLNFFLFFYTVKFLNHEFSLFNLNNLIIQQLFIFTFYYLIFIFIIFNLKQFIGVYSLDMGVILIQIFFSIYCLLISLNLLIIFIILEILNILIIFSFIVSLNIRSIVKYKVISQINWLVGTLIYQFILNFFSSIFYFYLYCLFLKLFNTTDLTTLSGLNVLIKDNSIYVFGLYAVFLIKLGVGPWIFFKLEIYKGFNLLLLIVYSLIYFLSILPFFYNLYYLYNLIITKLYILIILFIVLCILLYFILFIFQYFNILIFFSISSLIFIFFTLLQFLLTNLYILH